MYVNILWVSDITIHTTCFTAEHNIWLHHVTDQSRNSITAQV